MVDGQFIYFLQLISGFTQKRGYWHGSVELREKLIKKYEDYRLGDVRINYWMWTENMTGVAEQIQMICSNAGRKPKVLVAGYSYGGFEAVELTSHLAKRGIDTQSLILCDPVQRSGVLPAPWPSIISMLGRDYAPAHKLSPKVKRLHSFYQTVNRPQGHKIEASDNTVVGDTVQLNVRHQDMDDRFEFHETVLSEAELMIGAING